MTPSLGQQLRQARERHHLSLADLAHETRIPIPRLEDLENDNYSRFGGMAYVRHFLRTYSRRLEVDAEAAVTALLPSPPAKRRSAWRLGRNSGKWSLPVGHRGRLPESLTQPVGPGRGFRITAAVCGVILVLGAGVLLWRGQPAGHGKTAPPSREELGAARPLVPGPMLHSAQPDAPTRPLRVVKAELVK